MSAEKALNDKPTRNLQIVEAPAVDSRPIIRIAAGELHVSIDRGIDALKNDEEVFQRDHRLVHIVCATAEDEVISNEQIRAGTPQVFVMANETLRERLTRQARWLKLDRRSGEWLKTNPTDDIVGGIVHRKTWAGIRQLVGVIEAPSMRPDGTIIEQSGYDKPTGYTYYPSEKFMQVHSSPTQEHAESALKRLSDLFVDFPYRSSADKFVPIAAILTLVARPAVRGAIPGFLFDASTRGSGKTLQTDVISLLVTGRPTARMNYPLYDDELEKAMASYAIKAPQIINFDNVTREFGGGPLDRCLTAEDEVELRPLGRSEIINMRWRSLVMATGNNITITGDTARRVLIARIVSPLENPENRDDFKHKDLRTFVKTNRTTLVADALTVLRAWWIAGKPTAQGFKPWGSFEQWSSMIPQAIVFAGGTDPMLCRPASLGQDNSSRQSLAVILNYLPRLDQRGSGLSSKAIVSALYSPDYIRGNAPPDEFNELREAIESLVQVKPGSRPDTTSLGREFGRVREQVVDGKKLISESGQGGTAKWFVVKA